VTVEKDRQPLKQFRQSVSAAQGTRIDESNEQFTNSSVSMHNNAEPDSNLTVKETDIPGNNCGQVWFETISSITKDLRASQLRRSATVLRTGVKFRQYKKNLSFLTIWQMIRLACSRLLISPRVGQGT
jgi:hypothetical protein